jgi:DNA-binding NarL/FixJ family response regulator
MRVGAGWFRSDFLLLRIVNRDPLRLHVRNPLLRQPGVALMAVAEFERGIIRERGVTLGRPPTLKRRKAEVTKLKAAGVGIREIGRRLKMAPSSVHAVIKAA